MEEWVDVEEELAPQPADMFVVSYDSYNKKVVESGPMPPGWNDRPPLLKGNASSSFSTSSLRRTEESGEEENTTLLKGMLRTGVPKSLRCAVWISNIVKAAHPHQKSYQEFRTLAKVQPLEHAYQTFMQGKTNVVSAPTFGRTVHGNGETPACQARVLTALSSTLGGIEYAPLIPSLTACMLNFMSEAYVFCAIRQMVHHANWYFPTSRREHMAWNKAFLAVLQKLHPQTSTMMQDADTNPIFADFFLDILPKEHVYRIMDLYTLEGYKVMFRFGVALLVLYYKERTIFGGSNFWKDMQTWAVRLDFDYLLRKAYGVHGRGMQKRLRFPRRHILARIIKLELTYLQYDHVEGEDHEKDEEDLSNIRPLGLVEPKQKNSATPNQPKVKIILAEDVTTRAYLAKWLPLSLQWTNMEMIYSTNIHGRALDLFYRHCGNAKHTILLLEVLGSSEPQRIIGMYASQSWRASNEVYGDGECFLFRIKPDPKAWKWKPSSSKCAEDWDQDIKLEQFMVGTRTFCSMGGNPNGSCGLRLNEDLTRGESVTAVGFENEPLAGTEHVFEIGLVEVYKLVREMDGGQIL